MRYPKRAAASGTRSIQWAIGIVIAITLSVLTMSAATADSSTTTMQDEIAASIASQGFWDESSTLDPAVMEEVVVEFGDRFAFAFTDRSFTVQEDPDRSAAALLALSTLDVINVSGGPRTLLFVTEDDATGASTEFPFANLRSVLLDFDRSDPEASFRSAAAEIAALGDTIDPALTAELAQANDSGLTPEEGASFVTNGLLLGLLIVAIALGALSFFSANKKKNRRVHTNPARDNTALELQQMSDRILDLDPRVTIANDAALKERYVDASDTYRDVLEKFKSATTGHELADLRLDISKARWKLDVINAELEGEEPPAEPFTRDNSGSAWDSTRGDGAS